jgi:hypothetical protein
MTLFQNGYTYPTAIALPPPGDERVPCVQVDIAGPFLCFEPTIGQLDTGAFKTMLTFATAFTIGIDNPKAGSLETGQATTANGQKFDYYVHQVTFRVRDSSGPEFEFVLDAAFAEKVRRNLFGVDWLNHMCVAVDQSRIHILRA